MNQNNLKNKITKIFENETVYFAVVVFSIFILTYIALYIFGLVPSGFVDNSTDEQQDFVENIFIEDSEFEDSITNNNQNTLNTSDSFTTPDRIIIDKIDVDSTIQKPQSQLVSVLDNALTKGAVYYPGSGSIENGNMLVFGHSTNWQVVRNQAYKTFNGLEKLNANDEITIEADGKTFIYKVQTVALLDENQAEIKLNKTGRYLTIATCNTFGAKQERWVVQAIFDREV